MDVKDLQALLLQGIFYCMPLSRTQKEEEVGTLTDVFKTASSVVFVTFEGLSVAQANEMRRSFAEQGISYKVAKKTLVDRALDAAGVSGEKPTLEGTLAIAWGDDFVAPAREVKRAGKQYSDAVAINGGIFDGSFMSAAEMTAVADIPPRETLYGQLANVINSPIQGLAVSLGQIAEQKPQAA